MPPVASAGNRKGAHVRAPVAVTQSPREASSAAPRRSARIAAKAQAPPPAQPQQSSRAPDPGRGSAAASGKPRKAATSRKTQRSAVRRKSVAPLRPKLKSKSKNQTAAAHTRQDNKLAQEPQSPPRPAPLPSGHQEQQPRDISDPAVNRWVQALEQSEPLEAPATPSIHSSMAPHDSSGPSRRDSGVAPSPSTGRDTSQQTNTGTQSTKRARGPSAQAQLQVQFAERNVEDAPSISDDVFALLIREAVSRSPGIGKTQHSNICELLQRYLDKSKRQPAHTTTDWERWRVFTRFRQELNEMLPDTSSFTQTPRDFKRDQVKSNAATGNEAVFQRTVLISAIDRSRLRHSIFDYNCEGQWTVGDDFQLPIKNSSAMSRALPGPKPDLVVSFKFQSLIKQLPIGSKGSNPTNMNQCIHPDGSQDRCFPFLLIEAKPRDESLTKATSSSIYAASQALYNIYCCMEKAGNLDRLGDVRAFSMSINAKSLVVRSHQIRRNELRQLWFVHEVVLSGDSYNGHLLGTAVRSILQDYAEPTLFDIVRDTFLELIRPELERALGSKEELEKMLGQKRAQQADSTDDDDSTRFSSGASATSNSAVLTQPPAENRPLESTKRHKTAHRQHSRQPRPRQTQSRAGAVGNGTTRSDTTGMSFDMSQAGI